MNYSTIRTLVHFLLLGVEHLFEKVNQFHCSFDSHDRSEGMIALRNRLHFARDGLHWRKMIWLWLDKRVTWKMPRKMLARESLHDSMSPLARTRPGFYVDPSILS